MATRTGIEPELDPRESQLPSVLAVVVTHNGRRWLRDCLVGLNTQTYPLLDVLVVDDATFDSRERPQIRRIAKRHLGRRRWGYVRSSRPLGYGGAINWAMSRVRTDADLLLFIHDDAALDERSVERMVARISADDTTAIVGPKIVAWDDPQRLEEVGMLTDRFGYPYKGLEEGEIDLGQHDSMNEVFYVTSTCMLIRHDVFKQLRGWDARMRAFSEDLDLCWRARLLGYSVRVEAGAKARHAIALATGQRPSPFQPARYFIRRNRFRTVIKNASRWRLLGIVPQFFFLTIAEMIAFVILRQPREIANLAKAFGWNTVTIPQAISERAKVQSRRKVSDLKLKRLTVSQGKRLRFYASHQRDRLEVAWGRRAELFARRSTQAKVFGLQFKGWFGVAAVLTLFALLLGFRGVWWSQPAALGELLPFPDRMTGLLRGFVSPWRGSGLGQPGPGTPALALLGTVQLVTLGAAGAAQKLLIVALGVSAFAGGYRLVADLVDRPGRIAAGAVYLFGPVGYAGIRTGSLGALVFGAAAPWVLLTFVRMAGWARPPAWQVERGVARVALGVAISGAFVPGSLFMYASAALLLTTARAVFVRGQQVLRGALTSLLGIALGWVLLLPWSATWFSDGGPLGLLRGESWERYSDGFSEHGVLSVMLGQTPDALVLAGVASALLGVVAVVTAEGQRRRLALAFWFVIAVVGLFCSMFATGWIRPFVANPIEAGVIPSACFAGLVGLAVGAFRLDLPRRGFGVMHWATLGALSVSALLFMTALGPAVMGGDWGPGRGVDREEAEVVAQVQSLFEAEAQNSGQFRALWVGEGWGSPVPSAARPAFDHLITGSGGPGPGDLFESSSGEANRQLETVIDSVETGTTDRGGSLLSAFNVAFVVLERTETTSPWLAQRDLALVRAEETYLLLRNEMPLARAAIYEELPPYVSAIAADDPVAGAVPDQPLVQLTAVKAARYEAEQAEGPGVVFTAERNDDRWQARIGDAALERVDGGWGNAFAVPPGASGELVVEYPRPLATTLLLIVLFMAWVVVLGSSFSRRKRSAQAPRVPRRPRRDDLSIASLRRQKAGGV
jgi:GT2 family glycosyltransferase